MRGVPRVRMLGSTQSAQMGAHTPSGARRIAIATGFHATPCTPRASADRPRPGRACGVAYLLVLFWEQKPGSHGTLSLFWLEKKKIQFPQSRGAVKQPSKTHILSTKQQGSESRHRLAVPPSGIRNNRSLARITERRSEQLHSASEAQREDCSVLHAKTAAVGKSNLHRCGSARPAHSDQILMRCV